MANTDPWKEYERKAQFWNRRRKGIYAKNKELIKKWRAIPWYKFWQRPSLEEQRTIIKRNWSWLPQAPQLPPAPFTSTLLVETFVPR